MKLLKNILIIFILGFGSFFGYIELYKRVIIENSHFDIKFDKANIRINNHNFYILKAETFSQLSRGLMFKSNEDLIGIDGMLFDYSSNPKQVTFWMKNTLIDLDLLLFNKDFKLIEIIEMNSSNGSTKIYSSLSDNVSYAVELKKDLYKNKNIKLGHQLSF